MNVDEMQKNLSRKAELEPEHQFENLYSLIGKNLSRLLDFGRIIAATEGFKA